MFPVLLTRLDRRSGAWCAWRRSCSSAGRCSTPITPWVARPRPGDHAAVRHGGRSPRLVWTVRPLNDGGSLPSLGDGGGGRPARRRLARQRRQRVRVRRRGRGRSPGGPAGGSAGRRAGSGGAGCGDAHLPPPRGRAARLRPRLRRLRSGRIEQPPVGASAPSRPSCCWPRPSARTKSSSARRAWRSRPGSRARSTTCWPTRWRAHHPARSDARADRAGSADRDDVLARVERAHELAKEGLRRPAWPSARCAGTRWRRRRASRRWWPSTARAPTRRPS